MKWTIRNFLLSSFKSGSESDSSVVILCGISYLSDYLTSNLFVLSCYGLQFTTPGYG
jgi:hypothetical protein